MLFLLTYYIICYNCKEVANMANEVIKVSDDTREKMIRYYCWKCCNSQFCIVSEKQKKNTESYMLTVFLWWALRDLNPGPSGYEPDALTN